jgi:tetratricopeptide (TPR) repeat protein
MTGKFLFALTAAAVAFPAAAAVTVLGNSSARICYLSAETRDHPAPSDLSDCDAALTAENLTTDDRVASFVNRGILKLKMGRIDAALDDFDEAIALDDDEAEAYLNKGMAMLRREQGWEQAVSLFDAALSKRTSKPEFAYFGRGVANEMGGRIRAAYQDYRQASALAPDWADPKTELARFTVRQP